MGVICRGGRGVPLGPALAQEQLTSVHAAAAANAEVGRVISTELCFEMGNLTSHGLLEGWAGI